MLNAKQRKEVKRAVVEAYAEKYPQWTQIRVTQIVENLYFGVLVAVASAEAQDGEVCIYRKDGVIIFDTTPELVRYLDMQAARVVSLKDALAAIVVLVTLISFVCIVFVFQQKEAITLVIAAMAGILGTYAGVTVKMKRETD